jgi:hypothetical protein
VKTFEEALETLVKISKGDADIEYDAGRYGDMLMEIANNERVQVLMAALLDTTCCPLHAGIKAFILGVRVGMEMETNETGGVDLR